MLPSFSQVSGKSRISVLPDHFATIDNPRDVRRIAHPLAEVLLLVVCATLADCDNYDHVTTWGPPTWTSCAATYPTSTTPPANAG